MACSPTLRWRPWSWTPAAPPITCSWFGNREVGCNLFRCPALSVTPFLCHGLQIPESSLSIFIQPNLFFRLIIRASSVSFVDSVRVFDTLHAGLSLAMQVRSRICFGITTAFHFRLRQGSRCTTSFHRRRPPTARALSRSPRPCGSASGPSSLNPRRKQRPWCQCFNSSKVSSQTRLLSSQSGGSTPLRPS